MKHALQLMAALAFALQSASAHADASSALRDALTGEAKLEYEAALASFGGGDFAGAAVKFRRAFEVSGDVRLLWNVAVCEKNLKHYARVLLYLERYRSEAREPMSPAHRREVNDVLARVRKLVGTLRLQVREDGAEVFVDEVSVGFTPLAQPLRVDAGLRRIRIRKLGYRERSLSQPVSAGAEVAVALELSPQLHAGQIAVSAAAGDAISLDGALVGYGAWQGTVASGEHALRVTARGKRAFTRELLVTDDQTRALSVSLETERPAFSPLLWVGAGVLVAGGLATATYFLLRPSSAPAYKQGSWEPGTIAIP